MYLGNVPTGSIVIRKATLADLEIDSTRMILIETPDGEQRWLPDRGALDVIGSSPGMDALGIKNRD